MIFDGRCPNGRRSKQDENKFPGDTYTCKETIVNISIKRSQGLGTMFSKRRKITFGIKFVYKEFATNPTAAKGKKKKGQSATKAQKLQRATDAGLWAQVYKHHRCRGKHCKQGPHCWLNERGNHHKLLSRHLEEIFHHIKGNIKEGNNEEEVDVNIEIPYKILRDVLNDSQKQKAKDSVDCRSCKVHASSHNRLRNSAKTIIIKDTAEVKGDRIDRLKEYCNWSLQQVAADLMVKGGVKPGIALQFVSNINKF
ncbi:hypothetical protein LX36DRAFT_695566 [Colletotrichum falcatum]|nr:hypothetical protein LX36DRAFT_695566 [Colletotrichum falcatum]